MANLMELGRLDYSRADLSINGGDKIRVHFWGTSPTFFAENEAGEQLGSLTIAVDEQGNRTVTRLDARAFDMVGEDGTHWYVRKAGCNCQGG